MAVVLEIILQVQERKLRSGEIKLSICSWFVEQWERIWFSWFQFISALYTGRCDGQIPLSHPSQINLPHSQVLSDHLLPVQKKITRCLLIWDSWADFLSLTESGILGELNMGRLSFAGTRIYREQLLPSRNSCRTFYVRSHLFPQPYHVNCPVILTLEMKKLRHIEITNLPEVLLTCPRSYLSVCVRMTLNRLLLTTMFCGMG